MTKIQSFSIDETIANELSDYCEKTLINKSKLVNKLIRDFLKNNVKNDSIKKN